jgi:hypothetical protein
MLVAILTPTCKRDVNNITTFFDLAQSSPTDLDHLPMFEKNTVIIQFKQNNQREFVKRIFIDEFIVPFSDMKCRSVPIAVNQY